MGNAVHIAIDGPVGAGKSDISVKLARELGFLYLYTGAMYRAITYICEKEGIPPADEFRVSERLGNLDIRLEPTTEDSIHPVSVFINGEDVTKHIFDPEVDKMVPEYSRIAQVRRLMVKRQQAMADNRSVVMEGRDIGLRVLPHAQLKIYLTASLEERSRRRFEQWRKKGILDKTMEEAIAETKKRDDIDMNREVDPLQKLPDSWELDTTGLSQTDVIGKIKEEMQKRQLL